MTGRSPVNLYNDFDIAPEVRDRIRKTYDGPLALAQDYMVFNVTKGDVRVRTSAVDEDILPPPALKKKNAPDTSKMILFSDFTSSGNVDFKDIVQGVYDEVNERYGTDYQPRFQD